MSIQRILVFLLSGALLVGCASGCGSEKGKGSNRDLDKPTRPAK